MPNKTDYTKDYTKLIAIKDVPMVSINQESFFTSANQPFQETYGWTNDELIGRSVTVIMPEHLRNMHMIGFSRFLTSEESRLIGKAVPVKILCKNDEIMDVELYILGNKKDNEWEFAATIKPIVRKK